MRWLSVVLCLASLVGCHDWDAVTIDGSVRDVPFVDGQVPQTCDFYCAQVMTACINDGMGMNNMQYTDMPQCLAACATYPIGTVDDRIGDTLGCRIYHSMAAAGTASNAMIHCQHAGPGGGQTTCGTQCQGYCDIAMASCSIYRDRPECLTDCATHTQTPIYTSVNTAEMGNVQACLLLHVQSAAVTHAVADCRDLLATGSCH